MKKPIYLDSKQPIEKRVNNLLSLMTIDEKIDQMRVIGCNQIDSLLEKAEKGENVDISCTFSYHEFDVEKYNKLQKHTRRETSTIAWHKLFCGRQWSWQDQYP